MSTNQSIVSAELRLSAQRAFLGRITDDFRLIKCYVSEGTINVHVIVDGEVSELHRELVSEAATEIVSDFPNFKISEQIESYSGPLEKEDILLFGWIHQRFEGSD